MSWRGQLLKAGILSNGKDVSLFEDGQLRNSGKIIHKSVETSINDTSNVSYTAAQLLGGLILRDPNGSARSDSVPAATDIIDAIHDAKDNDSFRFLVRNTADSAETITVGTNTGVTLDGTMTVAQNETREFLAVVTSVSSETVTIYSLGVNTH